MCGQWKKEAKEAYQPLPLVAQLVAHTTNAYITSPEEVSEPPRSILTSGHIVEFIASVYRNNIALQNP